MSATIEVGVIAPQVRLVPDESYLPTLRALIAGAERRCLCSIFIVDLWPWRDRELKVDHILLDLQEAAWRGADVRLLIGGSRSNLQLAELADAARSRALSLGIPCRWLTSQRSRGSHVKLVIADDRVLTGSHNWSVGAFNGQTQDSVLVSSPHLAIYLAARFEEQWRRADGGDGV